MRVLCALLALLVAAEAVSIFGVVQEEWKLFKNMKTTGTSTRWVLLGLLSVAPSAAREVQLVTEPRPGEEYVSIHGDTTRQPFTASASASGDVPQVEVSDEGTDGELPRTADLEERNIMARKIDVVSKKVEKDGKDELEKEKVLKTKEGLKKVQIQSEGNSGVKAAPVYEDVDDNAVPQQKYITVPKHIVPTTLSPKHRYEVIPVNKPGDKRPVTDEGTFDFVDSPLADKHLVPSGSSQSSRVNVKKGPNGQDDDYEYYYYYYYYNEDEDPVGPAKHASPARSRRPVPEEEVQSVRNNRRNRYTTIERNRPAGSVEAVEITTPEPASNEVLPQTTRGGNRGIGSNSLSYT